MAGFKNAHKELAAGWHEKLADLKKPYFEKLDARATRAEVGRDRPSILINYFGLDGSPILRADGSQLARAKLYKDPDRKYSGRVGDPVALYFPRGWELRRLLKREPDLALHFVEGEHKAWALMRNGMPAVGFQGVSGWQAQGNLALGFDEIAPYIKNRCIEIDLDSDVPHNPDSRAWMMRLARQLQKYKPESVGFRALPTLEIDPANIRKSKTGADDFISEMGSDGFNELPCVPVEDAQFKDWDTANSTMPEALQVLSPITADWLNTEPPKIDFGVDGLIARHEISALAARGGSGKTTVAITLGMAIATGQDALGLRIPAARPVLYCMLERHERNFRRRVHRAAQSLKRVVDDEEAFTKRLKRNFFPVPLAGQHLGLVKKDRGEWAMNTERIDELAESCRRAGIEFIFIDTLSRLHGGSGIDDSLAITVVRALERLVQLTECGVIFLAHVGKQDRDDMYSLFGSSVWVDATSSLVVLDVIPVSDLKKASVLQAADDNPAIEIGVDMVIRMQHRRSSEYSRLPDKHFVVYGQEGRGGEIAACTLGVTENDQRRGIVWRVRAYYAEHGSFTKHAFFKAGLSGSGRERSDKLFDELVEAQELVLDRSKEDTFEHYRPAPLKSSMFPEEPPDNTADNMADDASAADDKKSRRKKKRK